MKTAYRFKQNAQIISYLSIHFTQLNARQFTCMNAF